MGCNISKTRKVSNSNAFRWEDFVIQAGAGFVAPPFTPLEIMPPLLCRGVRF